MSCSPSVACWATLPAMSGQLPRIEISDQAVAHWRNYRPLCLIVFGMLVLWLIALILWPIITLVVLAVFLGIVSSIAFGDYLRHRIERLFRARQSDP